MALLDHRHDWSDIRRLTSERIRTKPRMKSFGPAPDRWRCCLCGGDLGSNVVNPTGLGRYAPVTGPVCAGCATDVWGKLMPGRCECQWFQRWPFGLALGPVEDVSTEEGGIAFKQKQAMTCLTCVRVLSKEQIEEVTSRL